MNAAPGGGTERFRMLFATVAAMRRIEEQAYKAGTSYYSMMLDAGNRAAQLICERYELKNKRVTVLCGRGNNGGDGFVVATRLHEAGADVTVVLVRGGPATDTAAQALRELSRGVSIITLPTRSLSGLFYTDFLIDAIYGIGFSGEPPEEDEPVFCLARRSKAVKIALDLPSGCNGDSGRYTDCIEADLTVAMSAYKPAHLVSWSGDCCGEVVLADTELSRTALDSGLLLHSLDESLCELPERKPWGHKGDNGRLVMICGSRSFAGAAVLACMGALRSGVGYLQLLSTREVCDVVLSHCPEVICTVLPANEQGGIAGGALPEILANIKRCTAVLAGCGMGNTEDTHSIIESLIGECQCPLLLDADGLNALEDKPELLSSAHCPIVLTPHPGEFSRLARKHIMDTQGDLTLAAARLSVDTGATLLLKGAVTGIFRGMRQPVFSFMGNDGLAKGGSGDLLAGIIASIMAQGLAAENAVLTGAWLHGRVAELAYMELNRRSMLPGDLSAYLSLALDELEEIERG